MMCSKTNTIRLAYVLGRSISIFSAFAGSMFAIYDYRHQGKRTPQLVSLEALGIFGLAAIATAIGAFTAFKFQGIKMTGDKKRYEAHEQYAYKNSTRHWKSSLPESIYLLFSLSLTTVYNYFLITATEATIKTFQDPNHNYPTAPLNRWGFIALLIKTLLFDIPFKFTTSDYEACEEIKRDCRGSKAGPWISQLVKPFSYDPLYKPTITWIKSAGVFSNVMTNYLGMLLSIPPSLPLSIYYSIPKNGWAREACFGSAGFILFFISVCVLPANVLQTLFFEGRISENIFQRFRQKRSPYARHPLIAPKKKKTSFLRKLLEWEPFFKKPIYVLFFSQGVIRGGSDLMPVVLFMRDIFLRYKYNDWKAQVSIMVPISLFVFMSTGLGTHNSEVSVAMFNYKKEFQDISIPRQYSIPYR